MPLRTMLAASLVLPILGPTAFAQQVTRPAGYEIVRVTDNPYREFWPRMNRHGQVVFTRWFDQSNRSTQEIYLYDSRTEELTRVTNDDIQDIWPDINDDGVICWRRSIGYPGANQSPGEIVIYRDGQITRLTDHPDNDTMPRINRWGHVVWQRYYLQAGLGADVFFYDGQSIRQITDDGASDNVTNHQAKVSDIGQIIWGRFRFDQTPWTSKIMLYDNGLITELTSGHSSPASPSINNRSVATWTHRLVPGETAIDIWENGQTTLFTDWGCCGTLNERSQIAFNRFHNDTRTWQQWLYRDEQFYRLTNDPFGARNGQINEKGEVTWDAGHLDTDDIYLLRRFALGDLNCDGGLDALDIEPFILALFEPQTYPGRHPECDPLLADINQDEAVDALDIEPFLDLLFP